MLSKIKFNNQQLKSYVTYCSTITNPNINNRFRVAQENENENHDVMRNSERFKYKTQTNENFLSQNHSTEQNTSVVKNIQVFSTSDLVKNISEKMSESRDRLGQWPFESESEIAGQGLQRLKNGRFNKVCANNFIFFLLYRFKKCLTGEKKIMKLTYFRGCANMQKKKKYYCHCISIC